MKKILLTLFSIILITACSDDNSASTTTTTGSNDTKICDYTFECELDIVVKDNKIYTKDDSIVFSDPFFTYARRDNWKLSDFINRLSASSTTFTIEDTLLTEIQVENIHHLPSEWDEQDEITFATYQDDLSIRAMIKSAYNECMEDSECYQKNHCLFYDDIDGCNETDYIGIDDKSNFQKISNKDFLKNESTCKLIDTKCRTNNYVVD